MAFEKRALFHSCWLPYALLLPQVIVTLVFFFWPAGQALLQSMQVQDAFGTSTQFVGFDNFTRAVQDDRSTSRRSRSPRCSRCWSPGSALSISLVLAVFADRVMRGAGLYKTLLIWPYAVAPAIAGVLWLFMFTPTLGVVAYWLQAASASTGITCSDGTRRCC